MLHIFGVVLRIQFTSKTFNGSESSGEVVVSIVMLGGTNVNSTNIFIRLDGINATEG